MNLDVMKYASFAQSGGISSAIGGQADNQAKAVFDTILKNPTNLSTVLEDIANLQMKIVDMIANLAKMVNYEMNPKLKSVLLGAAGIILAKSIQKTITVLVHAFELEEIIADSFYVPVLKLLKIDTDTHDVKLIIRDPKILGNVISTSIVYETGKIAAKKLDALTEYIAVISVTDIVFNLTDKRVNSMLARTLITGIRIVKNVITLFLHKMSSSKMSVLFSFIAEASMPILATIIISHAGVKKS